MKPSVRGEQAAPARPLLRDDAFGEPSHRFVEVLFAGYKGLLSPILHALSFGRGGCCYQPTCSEYAALACAQHGAMRGSAMAAWRLLRCNPLSRGGWDPVPPAHRSRPAV